MDMTIARVLSDMDRERLARARRMNGNPVLVDILSAAIDIDSGTFGRVQHCLLDALNAYVAGGACIPTAAHELVDMVRRELTGGRYQECALRATLDLVDAIFRGATPQQVGLRIGALFEATAQLKVAKSKLRMVA